MCDSGHSPTSNTLSTGNHLGWIHPKGFQVLQEVDGGIQAIIGKDRMMVARKLAVPKELRANTASYFTIGSLEATLIIILYSQSRPNITGSSE